MSARVEFGASRRDLRRRRREASRAAMRRGSDLWAIVVLVGLVAAGLVALAIAADADDPLEVAVVTAPLLLLLAVLAWAMRPVKTRERRRRPAPDWACEVRAWGLRIAGGSDEATFAWTMVGPVAWEANWLVVPVGRGEVAIPRDSFAPGDDERFAAAVASGRRAPAKPPPPPVEAARFHIAARDFDHAAGKLSSRPGLAAQSLLGGLLIAALGGALMLVGVIPPLGAVAFAALGAVTGIAGARDLLRARAAARRLNSGDVALWFDGDDLVRRGEDWEHRFPRRLVDGVTPRGDLLWVSALEAGVLIPPDAVAATPALSALVAERTAIGPEPRGGDRLNFR